MAPPRNHQGSLRLGRLELSRLAWALVISIALHLSGLGFYEAGKALHVWEKLSQLRETAILAALTKQQQKAQEQQQIPLEFVDVSPQAAIAEAPKDAKYYSSRNSQAANPEAEKDTNIPKIDGKQIDMVRVEDVQRSPFDKLQPTMQRAKQDEPEERAKPQTPAAPGDLAMAKPETNLRQDTGTAEQPKPRTIKEALLRQNRNQRVGEKMKQDGGTTRFRLDAGLDAKATPFGVYDAAFIAAVEDRWFTLLDNMSYDGYRSGRVVLQFHLNQDGRITEMKVLENSVGETLGLLCQKAVLDPAPFDRWPREMRLMVDKDYRDIQFAFYYN